MLKIDEREKLPPDKNNHNALFAAEEKNVNIKLTAFISVAISL